jgi:sialic acid synthase SpsE
MVKRRRFPASAPYVVALADRNHDGRVAMARRLVALAARAGASAVKFTIPAKNAADRPLPVSAWPALRSEAGRAIDLVLAPQDAAGLSLARRAHPDAYQIDPWSLGDVDLLRRVARERRPVLVVAAGATTKTIAAALAALRPCPVVLLHAVLSDGLAPGRARLRYVPWLASRFRVPVGYAGREPGLGWALVAATLGAVVIEKLLTVDRSLPGADHAGSLEPDELASLVASLRHLKQALAPVGERRVFSEELPSLEVADRGLVARRSLQRGHALRGSDFEARPGAGGLTPRLGAWLTGRRLRYDVEAGEPLTFGLVEME